MSDMKIQVRGIDPETFDRLQASAIRNERTREGEARMAIRAWVQPVQSPIESHTRAISERLNIVFQQASYLPEFSGVKPTTLAERIGEETATRTLQAFAGEAEPTFNMLDGLANELGCSADWLKHGTGVAYPVEFMRFENRPEIAASKLIDVEGLKNLHLLRSDDKTGNFWILQEFDKPAQYRMYHTPYHISEQIGAGGESDLCYVFDILKKLYELYTTMGRCEVHISSYLVPEQVLKEWRENYDSSNEHPLNMVKRCKEVPWWEDVWDNSSRVSGEEHWPGMSQLRSRILRAKELNNQQ